MFVWALASDIVGVIQALMLHHGPPSKHQIRRHNHEANTAKIDDTAPNWCLTLSLVAWPPSI